MQVISLFAGIGGFELAASWAGMETVLSCEIDPFCRKALKKHFPNTYLHGDIKTLNLETIKKSTWNPHADTLVCGGFP